VAWFASFLHPCGLDNYIVGSLGFWWCHSYTGSMVTWTMQARCQVHVPIHISYVAVLHDDNWRGQILVFSPENKQNQACVWIGYEEEDVFLCHDVTVTFPTLVTPSSLAKLNGRVQPPLIPEQLLGIQLTLMVQLIPKTMACMFSSPYHGHGHCTLALAAKRMWSPGNSRDDMQWNVSSASLYLFSLF